VRWIGVMRRIRGPLGYRINHTVPIHRGKRGESFGWPAAFMGLMGSVIPGGLELPRLLDGFLEAVPVT